MIFDQFIGGQRPLGWTLQFWPVLASSFACGLGATWLCKKIALKFGIVDRPNATVKTHREPIAYLGGVGPVVNDPVFLEVVRSAAEQTVGRENIITPEPSMGSDDMARFLERVPGCYFSLGAGNEEKGYNYPVHHPRFDLDEKGLTIGVETLVRSAFGYLRRVNENSPGQGFME